MALPSCSSTAIAESTVPTGASLANLALIEIGYTPLSSKKGVTLDKKLEIFGIVLLGTTITVVIVLYILRRMFRLQSRAHDQEIREVEEARQLRYTDPDLKSRWLLPELESGISLRPNVMPVSELYGHTRRPSRTGSYIRECLQGTQPGIHDTKYITYNPPDIPVAVLSRTLSDVPRSRRSPSPRLPISPRSPITPARKLRAQRSKIARVYLEQDSQTTQQYPWPLTHARSNSLPLSSSPTTPTEKIRPVSQDIPSPKPVLFKEFWGFPPLKTSSPEEYLKKSLTELSCQDLTPLPIRTSIPSSTFIVDPAVSAAQLYLSKAQSRVKPVPKPTVESVLRLYEDLPTGTEEMASLSFEDQTKRVEQWLEATPSEMSEESDITDLDIVCRGLYRSSSVYSDTP